MKRFPLFLLLALTVTACGVVPYRNVQRDFNNAVREDNEAAVSPFMDSSTAGYETVFNELTPEYINGKGPKNRGLKEPRLRPNAWMLRSVSAWRLKKYTEATTGAANGLALDPDEASRDAIIMSMMEALTAHSEVMDRWVEAGRAFSQSQYDDERENLARAWKKLTDVEKMATDATPKSTLYYLHYQKWRLAQDWGYLITTVKDGSAEARNEMRTWAKDSALGKKPLDAADAERDQIPAGTALHKLIVAQGG
jgi:hypothetical protein